MDVKFSDCDEVYYRICDCCEDEDKSSVGLLHWEEPRQFDLCYECLKDLFLEHCLSDFKLKENVIVKRSKITEEERKNIFERDNFECLECGSKENLSIDHILPFSLGGTTDPSNLQTLCKSCNSKKGNRM